MRSLGIALAGAALIVLAAAPVRAADSNVGTWKTNLAKSKWDPGPAPTSPAVIKVEPAGEGITVTNDGVNPQGQPTHTTYTAKYDGKDNPMTGNPNADTIAIKRIDANTIETVTKKGGKVIVTSRTVVSSDGKTRTTTQDGVNAQGQKVHNVIVSDRQ